MPDATAGDRAVTHYSRAPADVSRWGASSAMRFEESAVGGSEWQCGSFRAVQPADLIVLEGRGLAADGHIDELYDEGRVGVARAEYDVADGDDIHRQFLPQLTDCCFEERLSPFQFAAGELPATAVSLVPGTPAQQPAAVLSNHGGEDPDDSMPRVRAASSVSVARACVA
jgi:hypothetical protein